MTETHFETLGLHAMGDRLALMAFCAPNNPSSGLEDKVKRLREALSFRGKRAGDPERFSTAEHTPRSKKTPKQTLKIEFG